MSLISNYIINKIIQENQLSLKDGTSGKFILRNYPLETFQSLIKYFSSHEYNDILLLIDDKLAIETTSNNCIKVTHEIMAQYRNENIQHSTLNLDNISYIVFITNETIDTLNDISTLTPDDISAEFENVIELIENTLLDNKSRQKLKNVCKVFLKDIDGLSSFEIESFVESVLQCMTEEGHPLEDAMGLSLDKLNSFKCHKCFESLKKSSLIKEIKKIVKPIKTIMAASHSKSVGNKTVSVEELEEKYYKDIEQKTIDDEFAMLDDAKRTLIEKFIKADNRELSLHKKQFNQLDWYANSIYRLFEKTKSDTSKKLGLETKELLEEKDIDITESEKENLLQYDDMPVKERESLKSILEPVYKKYKGYIEDSKSLRNKWDKFLYPSQSKSNDFILGVLEAIKKLKSDVDDIDHINVSLKQSQTTAIMRNYSKHAINYLHKRYSVLNSISQSVHFNFQFIQDIEEKILKDKNHPIVKKYKKGSLSKSANELHFIIQAQDSNNEKLSERKLIWSFNSNSILSGYKEDIDSLEAHLKNDCLYSNIVYRVTGSEKGEKKPLSLFDFSSLESRGKNSGFRLFPATCDNKISIKNIIKSAEELLVSEEFKKFKELLSEFIKEYTWILEQLDIKKNIAFNDNFDFNRIEGFSKIYINITKILFDNSENDKLKKNVIEPFLSLVTVRIGKEDTVIIPSYHPLRIISYFVKLKHTFDFVDSYVVSNTVQMIKEDLYFSDLEQSFSAPYYPEVFRLFDVDGKEESLLHISEICDDYTILEPIKSYLESGQSTDSLAQTTILTKVIENYLSLNNHKQSSLKILLHAVNNYDFPVKFMKKLMSLDFVSEDNNFEIYLNDVDASHIRKMYRAFLVNQNSKDAEEALEYNEVSFLSNIRLNAFDQSFKQLDNVNDHLNIAFLNDFVSSKAKLEFRKQVLDISFSLFDYHPTMWSKRKYMTEKEMTVGKYLVSPSKSELTSSFYDLLYLTMSTHKDDYKDKIPTLNIDRSHKNLYTDLEAIHKRTDWVVNLDSLLDKKILEEFGANVIKYRKARHINRNLVISSKANTLLLESHLKKKFIDFNINNEIIENVVDTIIKSANDLSGDVLLKAIGKGCFANEMLGLVLTKTILEHCSSYSNIMIYIDDYADWFLSSINSEEKLLMNQNNVLADILSITPIFDEKCIATVYIDIVEVKFCNEVNRAKLAKKSLQQTKDSYTQIKKVFEDNDYYDKEYWLAKISDLIVETHHKSFANDLTSEDIRNTLRLDKNINFVVRGMSYVFVYDYEEDYQSVTGINGIEQYIIGLNSIKSIIEALPDFNFISNELTLPKYNNITIDDNLVQVNHDKEVKNEIVPTEIIDNSSDTDIKKLKKEEKELEETEGDMISQAVKKVVMYHKYRAKVLRYLFTPNAVRISLEPELGWNENIFYKMANDFLSVERLQLLRVEVVPGSYDLVFQRKQRQVILYQDCLENREQSNDFGNTKILLGRNEENNDVVYYNLDSEDPHALIAGMTKSGKSVLLNIFIIDLIRTNALDELELILVDPKQVEFTRYKNIPYLDDDGIITNKDIAIKKLHDVVEEMEKRYTLFQEESVNDLIKYNTKTNDRLARIVLIFDEFADWMLDDEFKRSASDAIQRLAGKARAAGIHLIVSTQRPDNTVVPMILRANLGAKFALRVDTEKNSNIIIDQAGAEKLLGYGHMITKFAGKKQYIQSAFMPDDYIDEVLELFV